MKAFRIRPGDLVRVKHDWDASMGRSTWMNAMFGSFLLSRIVRDDGELRPVNVLDVKFTSGIVVAVMTRPFEKKDFEVKNDSLLVIDSATQRLGWIYAGDVYSHAVKGAEDDNDDP